MSWNGTVYCSFCGQKGHNRRTCPSRKKYAEQNPNTLWARELEREKEENRRRASRRKCSYCRQRGHNRPTCKYLKADMAYAEKKNEQLMEIVFNAMKEIGLGVGSLVLRVRDPLTAEPLVVTKIHWDRLNMLSMSRDTTTTIIQAKGMAENGQDSGFRLGSLSQLIDVVMRELENKGLEGEYSRIEKNSWASLIVEGPISSTQVEKQILAGPISKVPKRAWMDWEGKPERRTWVSKDYVDFSVKVEQE